jgi:hypothetical protein
MDEIRDPIPPGHGEPPERCEDGPGGDEEEPEGEGWYDDWEGPI